MSIWPPVEAPLEVEVLGCVDIVRVEVERG